MRARTSMIRWYPAGACPLTPTIILRDTGTGQRTINRFAATGTPDPNLSKNTWLVIDAPIASYGVDWAPNGNIDMLHIRSVEIIFSAPTNPSYYLWVDDLTFTGGSAPFQCGP